MKRTTLVLLNILMALCGFLEVIVLAVSAMMMRNGVSALEIIWASLLLSQIILEILVMLLLKQKLSV